MVVADAVGTAEMSAKRFISPSLDVQGVGTAQMRPYRGQRAALNVLGEGILYMRPARTVRAGLIVSVNELTQDDVTGAVLEAKVEGDLSLKQAIRLLLAATQGDATGLEGATPVFKSLDGMRDRITATYAAGTRTVTARDVT